MYIEFKNINKAFGSYKASDNVSFSLPAGSLSALLGPSGSGKTTITRMARTIGVYINADDIKRSSLCSDLEAAVKAEELREEMIEKGEDFTFETVLSTDRNLKLLKKAKEKGLKTVGLLGKDGGKLKGMCDYEFIIPGETSDRIQEIHMMILHIIIEGVERILFPENYR